jgi:hypothetical protein
MQRVTSVRKKGHYASVCKSRSTVGEVEDCGFLGEVNSNDSELWIINLKVKDTDIQFKIDTGADLSVVPEDVFKMLARSKAIQSL